MSFERLKKFSKAFKYSGSFNNKNIPSQIPMILPFTARQFTLFKIINTHHMVKLIVRNTLPSDSFSSIECTLEILYKNQRTFLKELHKNQTSS